MNIPENDAIYYIRLLEIMGTANPRSIKLMEHYGGVREALGAVLGGECPLKEDEKARLHEATEESAEYYAEYCENNNISVIGYDDRAYPEMLRNIFAPPLVLFVEGTLGSVDREFTLAIVGTRKPTNRGIRLCARLTAEMCRLGATIVSGMACGLDSLAHKTAVEEGARTIGVLAVGHGIEYPSGSMPMRKAIVESGGALISELLPLKKGGGNYFPIRNRLMSGLALGTVVIEAPESSGCLLTADCAVSQNRDVFFVTPEDGYSPSTRGAVKYLREGATAVYDYTDIAREYTRFFDEKTLAAIAEDEKNIRSYGKITETEQFAENNDTLSAKTLSYNADKPTLQRRNRKTAEKTAAPESDEKLSAEAKMIKSALYGGTKTADEIADETGLDAELLSEILLDMELDGIIESCPPASYRLLSE